MARQEINLGTAPTGAGGDTTRSTGVKINAMTTEIYNKFSAASIGVTDNAAFAGNNLNPNNFRTGGQVWGQFVIGGILTTGYLTTYPADPTSLGQVFLNAGNGVIWTRVQTSSAWTDWQRTYNGFNAFLAPESGGLMNSSSIGNWRVAKFANGFMTASSPLDNLVMGVNEYKGFFVQAPLSFPDWGKCSVVLQAQPQSSNDWYGFVVSSMQSSSTVNIVARNGVTAQTLDAVRITITGYWN